MTKPSDIDDWLKQEEHGPDDGLGDDWESAFQAEDFDLAVDQGPESEFFLSPGTSNPYRFSPPAEGDLASLPNLDQELEKPTRSRPESTASAEHKGAAPASGRPSFGRFLAGLPFVHKLALAGSILGGLAMLAVFLLTYTLPRQPALLVKHEGEFSGETSPVVFPAATGPIEISRPKWDFKPFYLPVAVAGAGERDLFLEVDLTLLLVLAPDEEIPLDQKIFIRELIYQYFRRQPLPTLRHYALARGEMNRNLLAWLREQCPEAPVETIIFNRYQLS